MAVEKKRGCGYRRVGGLYLVSGGLGEPCHKLPISLDVCPSCHGGIKPSRGFTWVGPTLVGPACDDWKRTSYGGDLSAYLAARDAPISQHCPHCPVCSPKLLGDKVGLLWIGGAYYPTPAHFTEEARVQGVSRRIPALPRGFEAGKHFVLCAHREAIAAEDGKKVAAIFHVFRPERVELIVRQSEATQAKIGEEAKRGVTVVAVPDGDRDHDPDYKPRKKSSTPRKAANTPETSSQIDLFSDEVRS